MNRPALYGAELSGWWPAISPCADYAIEAAVFGDLLDAACQPIRVLELGSGGGHCASHLSARFEMTLVDRAPAMVELSRTRLPDCRHVVGDMLDVKLGDVFDAVFVHDAVSYLTTGDQLGRLMTNVWTHLAPGGAVLVVPDFTRETFRSGAYQGGGEDPVSGRSARYLEWLDEPSPQVDGAAAYLANFAFLLREPGDAGAETRVAHDMHQFGLFAEATWVDRMEAVGFEVDVHRLDDLELGASTVTAFVGVRPGGPG